jgi:hypothetical protein
VINGIRCYVVESKIPDGQRGGETIISPRQGYLAIGRKWTYRGRTYSSRRLRDVHEVVPGIWAPERIEEETTTIGDDGASRFDMRRRIQVVGYQPGQLLPAASFRVDIRYGVDLIDRSAGSAYHNDPWWPEVGAMLREKFGWPPPDFSPLRTLSSGSERKLDGQPAPPLHIASWLNTKPMDLAALRGKVVLVEFGNIWDTYDHRYSQALRELYSLYHSAGLEIVSIHSPAEDADEIRRFARDYRLPYPVVIDEGKPGSVGKRVPDRPRGEDPLRRPADRRRWPGRRGARVPPEGVGRSRRESGRSRDSSTPDWGIQGRRYPVPDPGQGGPRH